jgi:AcrR family transcriptional regulator
MTKSDDSLGHLDGCCTIAGVYDSWVAHVSVGERRPQLIDAAIALMSRQGVAAGSTRAIAAEAGVAQAIVHYVFGSKERLYGAVIEQLTVDLIANVRGAAPQGADFVGTLGVLASHLWRSVLERPDVHELLLELQMHGLRVPQLRATVMENQAMVIAATGTLIEDAAVRTGGLLMVPSAELARYFLAGFDGLTLQHLSAPDAAAEWACLEQLVASVLALATGQLVKVELSGMHPPT